VSKQSSKVFISQDSVGEKLAIVAQSIPFQWDRRVEDSSCDFFQELPDAGAQQFFDLICNLLCVFTNLHHSMSNGHFLLETTVFDEILDNLIFQDWIKESRESAANDLFHASFQPAFPSRKSILGEYGPIIADGDTFGQVIICVRFYVVIERVSLGYQDSTLCAEQRLLAQHNLKSSPDF
jgi:hypothetical protein